MKRLRVTEIFYSVQGETSTSGIPTVFVRLTGCPLRCQYCDTSYAFQGGQWYDFDTILQKIKSYSTQYVTLTGGEPLAQKACIDLLTLLCNEGYRVSLETSGAIDVSLVDPRVFKIVDVKTPGSKEVDCNLWSNIEFLSTKDELKFVICNHDDYLWSKKILFDYNLHHKAQILFSPSYKELNANLLADWVLEDQLPVRLQIQLHKYLWGDEPGR